MRRKSVLTTGFSLVFSACVFLLGACSINPADVINGSLSEGHYTVQTLAYGKSPRQTMDVYRPRINQGKTPIVFVYGGAWRSGKKADYKFIGHALTQLGHPVIIPDYQLYPAVKFPVFVDDVAKAIKAAELRAEPLLGSPLDKFVLMGHSAGAHSAALLYTDQRYLNRQRVKGRVAGFIGLAGPYDLILENPEVADVFANAGSLSQPIDFIKPGLAPALVLHGQEDKRVLPFHTDNFVEALVNKGVLVEGIMYPNVNHIMVVGAIAQPLRGRAKSFSDIEAFLAMLPFIGGNTVNFSL